MDFPDPDCPTIAIVFPFSILRLISESTFFSPSYENERLRYSMPFCISFITTASSFSKMGFSDFRILSIRSIEANPRGILYDAFDISFKGFIMLYRIVR